ncbi:mlr9317 (plasmid) [Mesorhizobium japonicum MAFF 303099]|uniref:Mlr9317 protein n=1 Tax=Mesorhizobium japonicum (strain LMG 29417 / CECT 9101 / MAFF 303099) TaxID=266835 RepID=Q981M0_RHILO|nr:mlr9317 [Mesorhizobium japonicum MAFF 303099]
MAISFPLALEAGQDMLEPGDGTKRRGGHRELDFTICAGAHQHGGIAVAVLAETLAGIFEIEPADGGDSGFAFLLKLHESQDFLHQRATGKFALRERLAPDHHAEPIAGRWHEALDIFPYLADAPGRALDIALGIADLPSNGVLIINVGRAKALQTGNVCLQTCLLHQTRIARGDRLGHRELAGLPLARILQPPNGRHGRIDGRTDVAEQRAQGALHRGRPVRRHGLIDPDDDNEPDNKLNDLIGNAFRIWQETAESSYVRSDGKPFELPGAAQMIFSDLGTISVEKTRGFSAYRWIRDELVRLGVPASEIAFMQDFKKSEAADR